MSASRRRLVLLVSIWILSGVLAFTAVRMLRPDYGEDHRGQPSNTTDAGAPWAGPAGAAPAVDLAATLVGTRYSPELTFQVTEDLARVGPPPHVADCRQFSAWVQQNGGIATGREPVHVLSMRARRHVDVLIFSVRVIPVAQVRLTAEQGPWVELACRDSGPDPTVLPTADSSRMAQGSDAKPHVLAAGQTLDLPTDLAATYGTEESFPPGASDYYLEVTMEVDGVVESRELRNGASYYRCCGRTTFMGYQSARYEWNLSPSRTLRYCAELRYTGEPPPRTCVTSQR
jgi:hypothetical protein